MNDRSPISDDEAWAAFERRDRSWDGRMVGGGQDDRHLLPAELPGAAAEARECRILRRPPAAARAAGYRACLRCLPDEVSREEAALGKAFRLLAAAEEAPSLDELAAAAGYSPHHFHRLFKRATGVTPGGLLSQPAGAAGRDGAGRQ